MSLDRSHTLTALGILMTGLFLTGCNPEGDAVAGSPTTSSASAAKGEGATVGNRKDGTVTGTLTYLAPGVSPRTSRRGPGRRTLTLLTARAPMPVPPHWARRPQPPPRGSRLPTPGSRD